MEEFQAAAMAQLVAAWRTEQVHAAGDVPALPQTPYLVVSVSTGSTGNYLLSAQHGSRSYRIAVQAMGASTGETNWAVDHADDAFLDRSLTVAGFDCTPCDPEISSQVIRDPDGGGLLTATLTYTFTAYRI